MSQQKAQWVRQHQCTVRHLVQLVQQQKVVYDQSNGAIFNDFKWPLPPVSRSRHSLMLNISETVRHTEIVSGTHTRLTQQCHFEWFWVILSALAKYSIDARSLCDSWASCFHGWRNIIYYVIPVSCQQVAETIESREIYTPQRIE